MRKYEFTDEKIFFTDIRDFSSHAVHRIRAVRDFGTVKAGDLGGWLEKEENLSEQESVGAYCLPVQQEQAGHGGTGGYYPYDYPVCDGSSLY